MAWVKTFGILLALTAGFGCEGDTIYYIYGDGNTDSDSSVEEDAAVNMEAGVDGEVEGDASVGGEIVVGFLGPNIPEFTGPILRAAQLAVDEVNSVGGLLNDREVRLEFLEEDFSDVTGSQMRQLVEAGAVSLVGPYGSAVALQMLNVAAELETPFFSHFGWVNTTWEEDSNVGGNWGRAPVRVPVSDYGPEIAKAASDAGCGTIAMIEHVHSEEVDARTDALWKAVFEAEGLTYAGGAFVAVMGEDATAELSVFEGAAMPDCFALTNFALGVALRDAPTGYADAQHFVFGGAISPNFLQAFVEDASAYDGTIGFMPQTLHPVRNPIYLDLYETAFGQELDPFTHQFMADTYDYTALTLLAIEAAGSTGGTAIRDAIPTVGDDTNEVTVIPGELAKGIEVLRAGMTVNYDGATGSADYTPGAYPVRTALECFVSLDTNAFTTEPCPE